MLFKEATTYVCVYIYISRTREKKEIVLFLGSLPPPPPLECEFYNHASLCTSLIRFIFIGYRFPPSPLRHFYAIRKIRVRETTRSSTEIFLCTINIPLSLSLSRSIRDEDTGFHRFPSPPFPIRGSKICRAKGKSNPAYQYLYLDPSIADHPIFTDSRAIRRTEWVESFGSGWWRKIWPRKEREREERSEGRVREARFPREVIKIFTSRFRCERPREEEGNGVE